MNITGICTYETPCGWCTRQNKECDMRVEKQKRMYGDLFKSPTITNEICKSEEDHQWECCGVSTAESTYQCKICGKMKHEPVQHQSGMVFTSL